MRIKCGFIGKSVLLVIVAFAVFLAACPEEPGNNNNNNNNNNNGENFEIAGTYNFTYTNVVHTWVFNTDKTFKISWVRQSERNYTGTWSVSGNEITLQLDAVMGVSSPSETFTASRSGKEVTLTLKGNAATSTTFAIFSMASKSLTLTEGEGSSDGGWTWTAVEYSTIWDYEYTYGNNTSTLKASIRAIAYGKNRFVAVGGWGKMAYSDDNGETWTAVADSTFSATYISDEITYVPSISGIAYGNKFVAVGGRGKMAYSPDGASWTAVSDSTFDSSDINAIAYGNNMFVAGSGGFTTKMAYSTDGITWTAVEDSTLENGNNKASIGSNDGIHGIAYGNGRFVAVGGSIGAGYYGMMSSTDGVTWTAVEDTNRYHAIAYGNGRFVAVGNIGLIKYSTDGITWTAVSDSTFSKTYDDIFAIAYGNNRFVAGGINRRMAYSADGITWTAASTGIGDSIIGIAYGNNRFVAGGSGNPQNGIIMAYADW